MIKNILHITYSSVATFVLVKILTAKMGNIIVPMSSLKYYSFRNIGGW